MRLGTYFVSEGELAGAGYEVESLNVENRLTSLRLSFDKLVTMAQTDYNNVVKMLL